MAYSAAPPRLNGNGGPIQPLTPQDPNIAYPSPQVRSNNALASRPMPMRDALTHRSSSNRDVIIPSSEWERVSPSDDRGRRPRPIKPPPSPSSREAPILPIPEWALAKIGPVCPPCLHAHRCISSTYSLLIAAFIKRAKTPFFSSRAASPIPHHTTHCHNFIAPTYVGPPQDWTHSFEGARLKPLS